MPLLPQFEYEAMMDCLWAATPNGYLDGIECVSKMKQDFESTGWLGNNWRQTEWPGFYIEYCLEGFLNGRVIMNMGDNAIVYPAGGGGTCRIDCYDTPTGMLIDAKTHSNDRGDIIVTNDYEALQQIVEDQQEMLFYVVFGDPVWDENRHFQAWHTALKGGKSNYTLEREKEGRPSRMRKSGFSVTGAGLYVVDRSTFGTSACYEAAQGCNSNGAPRPSKAALDISIISPVSIR